MARPSSVRATTCSAWVGGLAAFLAQHNGGMVGHAATEPLSTVSAKGSQQAVVAAHLLKYYGTDQDPRLEEPLHTVTTRDRFGLAITRSVPPPLTEPLARKARQVAGVQVFFRNSPPIQIGGRRGNSAYQLSLQGSDIVQLYTAGRALEQRMRELPEIDGISSDLQVGNPQVAVEIDRERASTLGVTAAQIEQLGETVRAKVKESSGIELDWEIKRIGLAAGEAA
jgi:hypothetical protein